MLYGQEAGFPISRARRRPILGPRKINPAILAGLFQGPRTAFPIPPHGGGMSQIPEQPFDEMPGLVGNQGMPGPMPPIQAMPMQHPARPMPPQVDPAAIQRLLQKGAGLGHNVGLGRPAAPIQQDMAALRQHLLGARMAHLKRAIPRGPKLRTAQPRY